MTTTNIITALRAIVAPGSTHLDVRLSRADIVALLERLDGDRDQHARDSAELRRLCAARDELRAENTRLRGEAGVLRGLLREAAAVIVTVEPESDDEADALMTLDLRISSALAASIQGETK